MVVYWRVSTSTASVEVVRLGMHAAREHVGYAFAKQDAYKLEKVGLSFNSDSVDAEPEAAASLMGNEIPSAVPLKGTCMCIGADKVLHAQRFNRTRRSRRIPRPLGWEWNTRC